MITFNKVWPAIKLINSRAPKLIGLIMYETNSIGTSSKARAKGVLAGKNNENIFTWYFLNVMTFKPINTEKDNVNVTNK